MSEFGGLWKHKFVETNKSVSGFPRIVRSSSSSDCWLVGWLVCALSSVSLKGLHQGWTQTSLYPQVIYFPNHHTTSHVFFLGGFSLFIFRELNTGTCLRHGDRFYSAGLHRNHVSATANTGEIRRGFGRKCGWMDQKGRNKQVRNPWQ